MTVRGCISNPPENGSTLQRYDGCDHHFEQTVDGWRCVHCDALQVPLNDGSEGHD